MKRTLTIFVALLMLGAMPHIASAGTRGFWGRNQFRPFFGARIGHIAVVVPFPPPIITYASPEPIYVDPPVCVLPPVAVFPPADAYCAPSVVYAPPAVIYARPVVYAPPVYFAPPIVFSAPIPRIRFFASESFRGGHIHGGRSVGYHRR
jgi:hypothetical protein